MRVSTNFLLGLATAALLLLIGLLAGGLTWSQHAAEVSAVRLGLAAAPLPDGMAPGLLAVLLQDLWPVLVLLLLLAAATAIWLNRTAVRRLSARLERAAVQVSDDGPLLQLPAVGDPEHDRLVEALNGMSERLAESYRTLREALAGAERVAAELSAHEAHLRGLLEAAPDAMVTLDDSGRVVDINAAAERLLDIDAALLRGRTLDACIDFELLEPAARTLLLGSPASPEAPLRGELDLVSVGGRRLPVDVAASLWRGAAGRLRTLCIRDITARRRDLAELEERAQRADVANEAKTRFLAAMSHEIRTPLNAIVNMNELLLESALDAEQRSYAATAGESARALLSIVNSVLDFSKIESGRVEAVPRETDPEEIVKSVMDLLAARAHARGLTLTMFCAPGVPERIDTDPGMVRQILLNLLGNAIRFTDEGAVQVRLARDADAAMLRIGVLDTGVGIAPEEQSELFSEFKQADGPGGRPEGGSGLGLAISRRLARLLGGDITLESAPGEGSCFTLALPVPAGAPDGIRERVAGPLVDCQVELCTDSAPLTDALAEQLRAYGVAVAITPLADARVPDGCCGALRLLCRDDAGCGADAPHDVALYRVGSRCTATVGARWVGSLRIPATPSALMASLAEALTKATPKMAETPVDDLAARIARRAAEALPVLLAEDSRSNQLVATSILGKVGFRVDIAENGLQAVAAVNRQEYALVLMDVAMPEMDGIEATGCIRALSGKRGRVPIVAMTANAFDEDRRRCLEAGMDGYLSKPIDRRALFEAVLEYARSGGGEPAPGAAAARGAERSRPAPRASRQTGAAHGGAPTSPWGSPVSGEARPPADGAALPVLDERVIAALVSDLSAALMPEVVATFVEEAHERIAAIEQALAAGDGALAGDHGHALKGSAATFGAVTLRDVALAIEQAGRGGDLVSLEQHVRGLRSCGEAVLNELQARYGSDAAAS